MVYVLMMTNLDEWNVALCGFCVVYKIDGLCCEMARTLAQS